jgi:hypothetical protein
LEIEETDEGRICDRLRPSPYFFHFQLIADYIYNLDLLPPPTGGNLFFFSKKTHNRFVPIETSCYIDTRMLLLAFII